mgnify:CR=1 FL=1
MKGKRDIDYKPWKRIVAVIVVVAALLSITAWVVKMGKARVDVQRMFDQTPMLYTVECSAQTIVTHKGAEAMKWVGDRDLIVPVKATVKVGFRLSDINDVRVEGRTVSLTLPDPVVEIQNPEVVYDEAITKVGFFRRNFSQEELSDITAEGLRQMEERMDSYQLIEPAQQQAQRIIAAMLRQKGYDVLFRAAPSASVIEGRYDVITK